MGLIISIGPIFSQDLSNVRKKIIFIESDTTFIDSLAIVPGTLMVKSDSPLSYLLLNGPSRLAWIKKPSISSIEVEYRVFPFSIEKNYNRFSFDSVFYRFGAKPVKLSSDKYNNKPIDFGKLSTSGSIGRSLSFGNRQDAILHSSLNLQMSGYLSDSIYMAAAISDNNLPIQPDGTTQNLNEIDKVSILFSKQNWKLQLGDFDLRQKQYFLNFYKRLQGIMHQNTLRIGKNATNTLLLSGAVAKGKFTRNVFQGIEGNQGPYRLKGANQELFFIVLAGTERVFIDGVMMQRGEDQDYIINYNTAEVVFTPKQMITKDKRIQVEFEYADRNYLNSQMYLNNTLTLNSNFSLTFGYFNNTDAKNSSINQTLSTSQKSFLSGLGDQVQQAFFSTEMEDQISEGKILYRKVDSSYGSGTPQPVYVYSSSTSEKLYSLSFYDKGQGQGNYILDTSLQLNGKVYKWIAPNPISGKKYGRYEPDVLLVTPKSQEIYNLSTAWSIRHSTKINTDLAMSKYDLNTFSSKDKSNDIGSAIRLNVENRQSVNNNENLHIQSNVIFEYASAKFKPVERLRSVEFMRDWGLDFIPLAADEKIIKGSAALASHEHTYLQYELSHYTRDLSYNGIRHQIGQRINKNNWIINNDLSVTQFSDQITKGKFYRPTLNIGKVFSKINNQSIGFKYSKESSIARAIKTDSITSNSFSFETIQIYTNSDPSKENKWSFIYFTRSDQLPTGKQMNRVDKSNNYNFQYEWMSNPSHQIRGSAIFRNLNYYQQNTGKGTENNLLGRVEYFGRYWKGAINGSSLYEIGSGQEPKKTFSYFEVPAGQGEYAWIDYNKDNIQQLNEFEVAIFRDQAKYFKIFTPTNDFTRSNYLQYNYQLNIDPSIAIASTTPLSKFIKRLYFQSNFQLNERMFATNGRNYNPFHSSPLDTSLISSEKNSAYSFSYNKYSQVWGIDMNLNRNAQLAYLSYGPESRDYRNLSFRTRMNLKRTWTIDITSRNNQTKLYTPAFNNRNYFIKSISTEPRLTYTKSTSWRLSAAFKIDDKSNKGNETAKIHSFILDGKYILVSNAAINLRVNFSKIQFNGNANSSVGYIMLDGLKPGNNGLWVIDLTKRLSKFIELNIMYEGRKSEGVSVVHLGRAQLRALL